MAAHGLNILWDFVKMVGTMGNTYTTEEKCRELREQMVAALDYAPGMDTPIIAPDDWGELRDAVKTGEDIDILQVLSELVPAIEARWVELGMPATMEEWRECHYRESE